MSILTGSKIKEEVLNGNIVIEPFDETKVNMNSYNVTWGNQIATYNNTQNKLVERYKSPLGNIIENYETTTIPLDMKKECELQLFEIDPVTGFKLVPNTIYLMRTNEIMFTDKYVPILHGRSSVGRLGITVHVTAGFGDIGFNGAWTLEVSCLQPIIIYPNVEVAQIQFETVDGDIDLKYGGKYNNSGEIIGSQLFKEFI